MFSEFLKNFHSAIDSAKEKVNNELFDGRTDHPQFDENDWANRHRAAINGQRYTDVPEGTPEASARIAEEEPLTYNDIQRIMPYKEFFDMNMDIYAKEADPEKRIQLLDFMGTKTPLGTLPGTARYLQIMRNTEEAVKRHGTTNYQYGETAKHFRDLLNSEVNKFNPRA